MSDIDAAAEAMGIPPELVSRSAAARAEASGTSTDDVLAAWGGGSSVAVTKAPEAEETPEPEPVDSAGDEAGGTEDGPGAGDDAAGPQPAVIPEPEPVPAPEPATVAPAPGTGEPPVLVGVKDNPWGVVIGAAGLFLAVVLLGLVGPSIPTDAPGERTSQVALSDSGERGQTLYDSLGCASCHTQMIRPVVADVGLGPVTLSDTNQVLGFRRYGPDLSDVGSRVSSTQLQSIVGGSGGHQAHSLSSDDMNDLVAYLLESHTSVGPTNE